MRTKLFICTVWVLLILWVATPTAFGQILNPRVTISGAGSFLRGERSFVLGGETFNTQFANAGRAKARLTLDLTKHFSIEGVYGFGTSNLRVTEQGGTPTQRAFGIRQHEIQFNILHFFSLGTRRVRPFLTTGVGALRFDPTDQAKALAAANDFLDAPAQLSSTNQVHFAIGGGIEGRFSRWLGLRLDVKDHISAIPRFGVPQTTSGPGGASYPVDGIVHNIQAEAGIVFYLLPLP